MTSFSPEPEFWIEDNPYGSGDDWNDDWAGSGGDDTGSGGDGPPDDPTPPKPPRRWLRWVALGAGLAVIAGFIAWQNRAGTAPETADLVIHDSTPTQIAPTSAGQYVPSAEPTTPVTSPKPAGLAPGGSDPNTRLPTTAGVIANDLTDPSLLKDAAWELVGYGPDGVLRYTPSTGRLVHTPVPGISSTGPQSVVVTDDATVIRPYDAVTGYVVGDGDVAEPLPGLLAGSGPTLPGPDAEHVWVLAVSHEGAVQIQGDPDSGTYTLNTRDLTQRAQLVLVDLAGAPVGPVIDIPDTSGINPSYQVRSDGAGYALFDWVGGSYRLGPDGPQLITHGQVLAAGPATMLLYECDDTAHCGGVAIDRATGERRALADFVLPPSYIPLGVTSPDGRWAAVLDPSTVSVILVDLRSGETTTPYRRSAEGAAQVGYGTAPTMVFSPDGRYLLVAGTAGVTVIDTDSGRSLGMLPVHPLITLAVRPVG